MLIVFVEHKSRILLLLSILLALNFLLFNRKAKKKISFRALTDLFSFLFPLIVPDEVSSVSGFSIYKRCLLLQHWWLIKIQNSFIEFSVTSDLDFIINSSFIEKFISPFDFQGLFVLLSNVHGLVRTY